MDIQGIMHQAQEMQKKMQAGQEELAKKIYKGSAGGNMVEVEISGDRVVKKMVIDPSLMVADEKDILEDLTVAAINDALKKVEDDSSQSMKDLTKGIPLPPGFGI